jgi:hypothetical protein
MGYTIGALRVAVAPIFYVVVRIRSMWMILGRLDLLLNHLLAAVQETLVIQGRGDNSGKVVALSIALSTAATAATVGTFWPR